MESPPGGPAAPRRALAAALARLPLLLLAWGALGGGAGLWPWGLAAAAAIAPASLLLLAPRPGRGCVALGLVALLPLFVRDSLSGGWDVARRALAPRCVLRPGMQAIRLERPATPVVIALAYAVTVMPGTLAVEVGRQRLLVHVLDHRRESRPQIAALERRLAAVYRRCTR
jgi:multicomponent Na+:H+ antiporter subunit E